MKKTNSTVFIDGRMGMLRILSAIVLLFAVAVCAQAQIKYTPLQAVEIIEDLNFSDPMSPPQSSSQSIGSKVPNQGSGAAKITNQSAGETQRIARTDYHIAVISELKKEAQHNNTIQGTELALDRVFDKFLPGDSGSPRYGYVVQTNNSLVTVLSK